MILDVITEDSRWDEVGLQGHAEIAAQATLLHLGLLSETWELSVMGCDDARIAVLNEEFRDKDSATNVLSWPAQELSAEVEGTRPQPPEVDFMGDASLGDIAVAYQTCLREAQEAEKEFSDHLRHLLVHGILHLLGYDHIRDGDAAIMESLEVEILDKLGISDPYTLKC